MCVGPRVCALVRACMYEQDRVIICIRKVTDTGDGRDQVNP